MGLGFIRLFRFTVFTRRFGGIWGVGVFLLYFVGWFFIFIGILRFLVLIGFIFLRFNSIFFFKEGCGYGYGDTVGFWFFGCYICI